VRLQRLTVPQGPGPFDDYRLAGSQAGQNLNPLRSLFAGAHEAHLRFAVGGHEMEANCWFNAPAMAGPLRFGDPQTE